MKLPGATGHPSLTSWFLFFLGSGFAGLVYEVVWLRLAMAAFGVTTPLVSIVLSIFMAGLALGSWLGGRLGAREIDARRRLRRYGAAEAIIGVLALAVPSGLSAGHALVVASGTTLAWDSAVYHVVCGLLVSLALLPCCAAMGATFPLAMSVIRVAHPGVRSFSFLYLANVLGAACGTLASAFVLVELLGFRATLAVAVAVNLLIAAATFALSCRHAPTPTPALPPARPSDTAATRPIVLAGLFLTGLVSMAMEVVWIRQLTPYLGNLVYAFAGILATYLVATLLGSRLYRTWIGPERCARAGGLAWLVAAVAGLLPLAAADPRLDMIAPGRLLLGVTPFCAVVGILTPMLVDRWSTGRPDRAGTAYAVNVLGSIAGPLLAGFVLLPTVGEHTAPVLLVLPLFAAAVAGIVRPALVGAEGPPRLGRAAWVPVAVGLGLATMFVLSTRSFETRYPEREVRRDHTATVIVTGNGMSRDLLINGTSTTVLTPVTKWMAHVPLVFLERPPADALVICFGMGTTFRSLLSWDIRVTAVELVPSVPKFFPYFHADAHELMRLPNARVVIDDGRRFLERSRDAFDVITIDPPNPPEAAGSSLLYSREFYALARTRLRPGGILQQWVPITDLGTLASVTRALEASFPHVRAFPSVNPYPTLKVLGVHYLASDRPIPRYSVAELVQRLPARAAQDLIEWPIEPTVTGNFTRLLKHEAPLVALTGLAPGAPALADDRPFNEYFLLRRWVFARAS